MDLNTLPKKIKVAGQTFKINLWGHHTASSYHKFGEFNLLDKTISIDNSLDNLKFIETLIHELLHCIYYMYTIEGEDDEERTVTSISKGLVQVYKNNPKLLTFINNNI